MKPTCHPRWCIAGFEDESKPCAIMLRNHPEMGREGYTLKQWWTDGITGEWRTVEAAFIGDELVPPMAG